MSNKIANLIAGILLLMMFFLAIFSIKDDTFTFDETAHVAAGYSYLSQKDYRLNPEHPPLIKDLAAFPLLFLGLNFPKDDPSWTQQEPPQWWFQFDFASQFLYRSPSEVKPNEAGDEMKSQRPGNNPDEILFWSRLPMILLLVFLGWFLFYWAKKLFGNKAALLSLFFFSFSPTFLAHGRLVTTDVGAALGVVLATYFWLKFLRNPVAKNIILAGLIFGLVMLIKFSLVLLIPFFVFITFVYALISAEKPCRGLTSALGTSVLGRSNLYTQVLKYFAFALLIGIIGMVFVVLPIYQYHILNYPPQQQIRDTQFLLSGTSAPQFLIKINLWMSQIPILRPFSQYLLGLLLAVNRSATGHTTYFLGEISAESWKTYFPTVYFMKEPLALHVLTLIVFLYLAWLIKEPFWKKPCQRVKNWVKNHFPEFAMLTFLGIYWLTSLTSKLNIGVRHLLPLFPFTFILVSAVISNHWLKRQHNTLVNTRVEPVHFDKIKYKYILVGIFLLWQAVSVISIYPHFLAYFNEAVGGPDKGYLYVVDSNLDWGQDLKRLKKWQEENDIDKIYLDYFGGGNPEYYLNKEKYVPWWGTRDPSELPRESYLAVSVNQLQGGRALPVKGYDQPSDYYMWIYRYEPPIAKIGHSIFVYYID